MEIANINDLTPQEIEKFSNPNPAPNPNPTEEEKIITPNERLVHTFKYILDFYYGDVSVDTILNFAPSTDEGFTKDTIVDVSFEMGLNAVSKTIFSS